METEKSTENVWKAEQKNKENVENQAYQISQERALEKRSLQAAKKGRVLTFRWRGGYLTKEVLKELLEEIERAGREKNKQPQISLNWAQAVLRVEYQELPEGMIRETKVVMEDANEGEREIIGNREKHRKCVESRAKE